MRLNKKKFARFIAIVVCVALMATVLVDFLRFPECYISTWKYQLHNDLVQEKEDAVKFYEENYVQNGRDLFGDNFEIRNVYTKGDR